MNVLPEVQHVFLGFAAPRERTFDSTSGTSTCSRLDAFARVHPNKLLGSERAEKYLGGTLRRQAGQTTIKEPTFGNPVEKLRSWNSRVIELARMLEQARKHQAEAKEKLNEFVHIGKIIDEQDFDEKTDAQRMKS